MGAHQYIRLPTSGRLPKLGIYPSVKCWCYKSGGHPLLLLVPEQLGKYPKNMVGAYKVATKLLPPCCCWYQHKMAPLLLVPFMGRF